MTRLFFFGTSEFAVPALERLCQLGMKPVAVITAPDRPRGRGQKMSPVPLKRSAMDLGLRIADFDSLASESFNRLFGQLKPELAIVASYGLLIPSKILELPKYGFLNIHPSLLPKYRGPTPIQSAILKGEKMSGVSVMLLDKKMDHGPILAQERVLILEGEDYGSLHNRLAEVGAELLTATIQEYLEGKLRPEAQNDGQASYTKLIRKSDCRIDWTSDAESISRLIRALSPSPAAWTCFSRGRLKILRSSVTDNQSRSKKVGSVDFSSDETIVDCGTGKLKIDLLKPESRSIMTGREFSRGYKNKQEIFA